jgi:quercetin dioxygenase-like cupin family protein
MSVHRCSLKGETMQTVDLNRLHLMDSWAEDDHSKRCRVTFPFFAATGTKTLSVVFFEIESGDSLATHTDSAEEIVLLLQGEVEATIGEKSSELREGEMVLIPAMAPHGIRNVGSERARCIGFFGAPNVVSTFEQRMMPFGIHVFDTAELDAATVQQSSEVK